MTRRSSLWFQVSGLGAVLFMASAAAAQAPQPAQQPPEPPPIKNLQVLPKDISRPELLARMQAFTQALGVRCSYCHVDDDPGGEDDMASDEKAPKRTARVMLRLAADINRKLAEEVGKPAAELTRVQCATCHRGVAIPKQLPEILSQTAAEKGTPAAIEQYRELRKRYYGAQAYDFSENALVAFAQRTIGAGKPDDALPFLQLNLEFYPRSARTYVMIGQAYARKNDKETAVKNVEKALELEPENAAAKRALEQLKK